MRYLLKAAAALLLLAIAGHASEKTTAAASQNIDAALAAAWSEAGVSPEPPASDEVFLRRIYLDAIGRIPTYAEARAFLDSPKPSAEKREQLIDELLEHPGYVDHWYNFWADLLRIHMKEGGGQFRVPPFIKFVRQSLAENRPYDEFVRELLTATGDASWGGNAAAGYTWRDFGNPLDHMADTVQRFLGTQLQCAQCHDHPFDQWTQMEFYHMAAFSYGMNPIQGPFPRITTLGEKLTPHIRDDEDPQDGRRMRRALFEVTKGIRNDFRVGNRIDSLPKLPHDYQYNNGQPNQVILPAAMYGEHPAVNAETPGLERVKIYADWMTSRDNRRFATVIVNRLWKNVMGHGLIEPVDELRADSIASHPAVLRELENALHESDFDLKAVLRTIFRTSTYQRQAAPPLEVAGERWHFTGPMLRRLTAEQAWDSLITLLRPDPEATNWKARQPVEIRWIRNVLYGQVVHQLSDEEIIEWVRKVADHRKKLETENADNIQYRQYDIVDEWIILPAIQKLADSGGLPDIAFPDGSTKQLTLDMFKKGGTPPRLIEWQQEVENRMIDQQLAELETSRPSIAIDTNWRSRYHTIARAGNHLRAAHLGSPAPLGHFLREFGQSDRELINNSNIQASIPQVLGLMNGEEVEKMASDRSMLGLNLALAESPEQKLDIIFLSILSRKPTIPERELLVALVEENRSSDVVFALLNSSQFLFLK
jgi:hypothetical protein